MRSGSLVRSAPTLDPGFDILPRDCRTCPLKFRKPATILPRVLSDHGALVPRPHGSEIRGQGDFIRGEVGQEIRGSHLASCGSRLEEIGVTEPTSILRRLLCMWG